MPEIEALQAELVRVGRIDRQLEHWGADRSRDQLKAEQLDQLGDAIMGVDWRQGRSRLIESRGY